MGLQFWLAASGAYFPDTWYPSALGATALLSVTAIASGRLLPEARPARLALLAFAAFVALNYLSILWAQSRGDALQAANMLLLYLAIGWTFSILPWTPRSLTVLLVAWSVGVAGFCAVELARATSATNLDHFFDQFRYATPLVYPNATAGLAVMGMWPALILSARRELPGWIRVGLLGAAVFLLEFAFLPQSRGALWGLVAVTPLVLIGSGDRLRLLARMLILGACLALTLSRIVHVDNVASAGGHVSPVLDRAATAILLSVVAAAGAGVALGLIERRRDVVTRRRRASSTAPRRSRRVGRRGLVALVVLGAVALTGAGVVVAPEVSRLTRTAVRSGNNDTSTGTNRLLSVSPEERFDYARVALRLFDSSPLLGVGAGNFGRRYDAMRHLPLHSLYVHDMPLRVLSETGIAGVALVAVLLVALSLGLWQTGREFDGIGRACSVAALAVAAYFLVHDSLDWLDQFPALAAPALALPLAAAGMQRTRSQLDPARDGNVRWSGLARYVPRPRSFGWAALIATAEVAACLLLGAPYLALRYTERAIATFRVSPARAYADLSRANSVNPLSADSLTYEGTVALDLGDADRARSAFLRADQREQDWYPHLELALLDAHSGQFGSALGEVSSAQALDAHDTVLTEARALIASHQRLDPLKFNGTLLGGVEANVFRPDHVK